MAEIQTSLEPGQYTGKQTVVITFPPNTRRAIITKDERVPVLTEILAYDTGVIPPGTTIEQRPFIAVTQDGRGNVIYDGGFPKFYNSSMKAPNGNKWPATLPTELSKLSPASTYFANGLKFIADPRKVGKGNRKILFVSNTVRSKEYSLLKSHFKPDVLQNDPDGAAGFRDTFEAISNIGGWVPTFYDRTTAGGGQINLSLDYLEGFAAVVFLASDELTSKSNSGITELFAQNIAQYRRQGGGVAIITDHCGGNYTSVQDALDNGSIFGYDATKVARYFDAYFSGNVDRHEVSVGSIRQQIGGDHPLFAGLSDSDMIFAGGSESLTVPELHDGDIVDHTVPYSRIMDNPDTYRVNVLVQLDDGTILTKPMKFIIINPGDVTIRDSYNRPVTSASQTYKPVVDYTIDALAATERPVLGEIRVGNTLVGFFNSARNESGVLNTTYSPLGGAGTAMPVYPGQTLNFYITDPFEYNVPLTINIPNPAPFKAASGSVANFRKAIMTHPYFSGMNINQALSDLMAFTDKYFKRARDLGTTILPHYWKVMGKARLPFVDDQEILDIRLGIYTNLAEWNANKPAFGDVGDAVIIANTNEVYYWDNIPMVWAKHPQQAQDIFRTERKAVNIRDNSNWVVKAGNTVKV